MTNFIFLGSKIPTNSARSHKIKRCLLCGRNYGKPRQRIKKQRHHFADKGPYRQSYGFSSSHAWMRELDHKEGWEPKNCFGPVVLEKILESPSDCKEIKPINLKKINPEYSLEGLLLRLSSNTLATWCEEQTHWKGPWYQERLKAKGEWGGKRWDG